MTAAIGGLPITVVATGTARSVRALRPEPGWPNGRPTCCRSAYFHVVFTLPAEIGEIAWQNKAVVYDLLFKGTPPGWAALPGYEQVAKLRS